MTLTQVPHVCVPLLTLLGLYSFRSAAELELVEQRAPELTCSEGLIDCHVSSVSPFSGPFPDTDDTVNVIHMHLKVILCCSARQDCEPCLQIVIEFQEADKAHQVSAGSGDSSDEEGSSRFVPIVLIKVCLSTPGTSEIWKTIQFKLHYSSLEQAPKKPTHKLLLTEKVTFGIPIVVQVDTQSYGAYDIANITVPSLEEVCSMNLEGVVKECDVPKLRVVTDPKRDVVLLQLENTDASQEEIMCQMIWNGMPGEVLAWPKGKREMTVPANIVVPCLCFQVWWERKPLRRELCPFKNRHDVLEKMRNNVSVSVAGCQMRDGGMGLIWNVTAPCSLEAEVWLCKKDLPGGQCKEVTGSKQILHNHLHSGWHATRNGHWRAGEFNVSSHPMLCVQMKIHGMKSHLEPQCPFATFRWRWSLPLVIGLLLVCLAILGAYFMQGVLQGYVWRWLKEGDVRGAVGGCHVVLLYPPDDDQPLPELLCHLGSSLQNLGFSVSLDMWSQGELSVLGPVPWLHSRLNQLKRHGGKVVLVLTPATWRRAEEWWAESWEKNRDRNSNMKEEEAGRSYTTSSACADVFTASLSCIVADYLQGRAGERFTVVQFESHPPEPPGVFRPLPELFRGLHVYNLPSQSLGFLTELAGARPMATASTRRKRAWGLRMASRSLAQGLSAFTTGTTVLHLSRGSHSHVGVGVEDSPETVPFQPCMGVIRPPSTTDTNPKVGEKDWV